MKKKDLDENLDDMKNKTFFSASKNALNGIIHMFKTEKNLRVDYILGAIVFLCSLFFNFTKTEFACLVLTVGFVIFAEMMNTVVEYVVNLITTKYNKDAKIAKDIAAGGVLFSSFCAVAVAYFLFIDKIRNASTAIITSVLNSKTHMLMTILFIVLLLSVILKGISSKKNTNYVKSFPSSRVMISFGLATYLFIITGNLLVGGISLILCIFISSLKIEKDKMGIIHVILSALIGILLVLIIYQLTLLTPVIHGLNWKLF